MKFKFLIVLALGFVMLNSQVEAAGRVNVRDLTNQIESIIKNPAKRSAADLKQLEQLINQYYAKLGVSGDQKYKTQLKILQEGYVLAPKPSYDAGQSNPLYKERRKAYEARIAAENKLEKAEEDRDKVLAELAVQKQQEQAAHQARIDAANEATRLAKEKLRLAQEAQAAKLEEARARGRAQAAAPQDRARLEAEAKAATDQAREAAQAAAQAERDRVAAEQEAKTRAAAEAEQQRLAAQQEAKNRAAAAAEEQARQAAETAVLRAQQEAEQLRIQREREAQAAADLAQAAQATEQAAALQRAEQARMAAETAREEELKAQQEQKRLADEKIAREEQLNQQAADRARQAAEDLKRQQEEQAARDAAVRERAAEQKRQEEAAAAEHKGGAEHHGPVMQIASWADAATWLQGLKDHMAGMSDTPTQQEMVALDKYFADNKNNYNALLPMFSALFPDAQAGAFRTKLTALAGWFSGALDHSNQDAGDYFDLKEELLNNDAIGKIVQFARQKAQ